MTPVEILYVRCFRFVSPIFCDLKSICYYRFGSQKQVWYHPQIILLVFQSLTIFFSVLIFARLSLLKFNSHTYISEIMLCF
jgi:hypothetical protein